MLSIFISLALLTLSSKLIKLAIDFSMLSFIINTYLHSYHNQFLITVHQFVIFMFMPLLIKFNDLIFILILCLIDKFGLRVFNFIVLIYCSRRDIWQFTLHSFLFYCSILHSISLSLYFISLSSNYSIMMVLIHMQALLKQFAVYEFSLVNCCRDFEQDLKKAYVQMGQT